MRISLVDRCEELDVTPADGFYSERISSYRLERVSLFALQNSERVWQFDLVKLPWLTAAQQASAQIEALRVQLIAPALASYLNSGGNPRLLQGILEPLLQIDLQLSLPGDYELIDLRFERRHVQHVFGSEKEQKAILWDEYEGMDVVALDEYLELLEELAHDQAEDTEL